MAAFDEDKAYEDYLEDNEPYDPDEIELEYYDDLYDDLYLESLTPEAYFEEMEFRRYEEHFEH
jgi:hypothetical protein